MGVGRVPTRPDPDPRGGDGAPGNKVGGWPQPAGNVYHPLSHFWEDRPGFELQGVGFAMDGVRDLLRWFLLLGHMFGISLYPPGLALVLTFRGVSWNSAHCESSVCLCVHLATVGCLGGLTVQLGEWHKFRLLEPSPGKVQVAEPFGRGVVLRTPDGRPQLRRGRLLALSLPL